MKHFAKWTFLLVMAGLIGFSATVLATQSARLAQILSQEAAATELAADIDAGTVDVATVDAEPIDVNSALANLGTEGSLTELTELAAVDLPMAQVQTGSAPAMQQQQSPATQVRDGVLNAVGTVEVAHGRQVVLGTSGQVREIAVEVGDSVQQGDLLLALDTTFLDWSLEQAEINFETARINFEELGETVLDSDVAMAEANLLLAQENLAEARQGPTTEEMAAAQAAAQAAWARYEELQEQPTRAQVNQVLASLHRAEINVAAAQREYDKIAWLPESSASSAADALQRATIDLEAAQAAFDEVNRPARESELQGALSSAQSAQANLNNLRLLPTAAQIADAEARLASAEAAYERALLGPKDSDMRIGELSLRQAMIGLEQARLNLENAQVVAPIDGTIMSIQVDLGQQASAGTVVATLADPLDVRLVVNVEQRDIRMVTIGQGVEISIYALPDEVFLGVVDRIAPIAGSGTGFVTFPVIIELLDGPLDRILPGMTASASFLPDGETEAAPATEEAVTEEEAAEEDVTDESDAAEEDVAEDDTAADDAAEQDTADQDTSDEETVDEESADESDED